MRVHSCFLENNSSIKYPKIGIKVQYIYKTNGFAIAYEFIYSSSKIIEFIKFFI